LNAGSQISVIFGRPLLDTFNALINCRTHVFKLSFGDKTLELNVFNACKEPREDGDVHELNLVEIVEQDQFIVLFF
jgi:hypothetical protein